MYKASALDLLLQLFITSNQDNSQGGRVQWLTLWEAKVGADHLRSGVHDQPGQHGKTLSLLKVQILAGRSSAHL